MTELPDKVDANYLTKLNPPQAAAAELARTVNKLIDYLRERGTALEAFAKPIDEIVDQKLGPHPDHDPELVRRGDTEGN